MQNPFQYQVEGRPHFRPVFKFLTDENYQRLVTSGSIRVPRIEEFRNYSYGGLIFDPREGQASIQHGESTTEIDVGSFHGYCATQHFLSESFEWALEENKETCALILNWDHFVLLIDAHISKLGFRFVGQSPCFYTGDKARLIDHPPLVEALLENPQRVSLLKPAEYSKQLEVRALWEHDDPSIADIFLIPELIKLCLPISFEELIADKSAYLNDPALPIGCRILIKGSSGPYPEFEIGNPRDIRSFVAYVDENGEESFGILEHRRAMHNATFSNSSVGVTLGGGPPIILTQRLNDIAAIQFFVPEVVKVHLASIQCQKP